MGGVSKIESSGKQESRWGGGGQTDFSFDTPREIDSRRKTARIVPVAYHGTL